MKKNATSLLVLALLALTVAGCSDFLAPEPRSFTSTATSYQTPEQIRQAVTGIYNDVQVLHAGFRRAMWVPTELRSDNTSFQNDPMAGGAIQTERIDEFRVQPGNGPLNRIWTRIYTGIQQCNTILSRIEGVEFSSSETKDQYVGEAKFLRAFFYFHLVRLWGGVPLVLRQVNAPDKAFSGGRVSAEEVYDQIITDATDAAGKLPEGSSSEEAGRATTGAARTLLAQVYMTRNEYELALEQLEQVMGMGYGLLADYADVFDTASENNQEMIFAVQYQAGIAGNAEASNFIYSFLPLGSDGEILPRQGFFIRSGFNIPTVDMIRAYEEADVRKEASIGFYVNPENSNFESVAIGDSIPYVKKYLPSSVEQAGYTGVDWPVYRYSHVLLMMAEALNEVGRTGEGYALLNEVRERVGLEPLSGLSQAEFREAVYHEMRVELAFENHRWYTLKRTGRAIEVMRAHGEEMIKRSSRLTNDSYNIEEYKLLYPLPSEEVLLNDLEQNPGYGG